MTIVNDIVNHFSDYPVFTHRDLKLYFRNKKLKTANLTRIIAYMKNSGRLYAIRKGAYTFKKDSMVAGFAYSPFYYGLLSALTIRELWTQNSRPDIITIRKVRVSSIHIFGDMKETVFVHHVPAKYFFGFDIVKYGTLAVPVSDPEKTLIDLFYYKVKLPIQDYSELLRKISREKTREYLERYDKHTATVVLNFIKRYKGSAESGKLGNPY
ncbi:MAG: type IV toxin-antitoxin system AbiEi family antitoxin domain-containing protein [Candidatus Micrarchaeia archaeon]